MIYKHQIRMAVMDIDGTLVGSSKRLSEYTKKILSYAAAAGIKLVIASGRPLQAIPDELLKLPGMTDCITSNGSSIFSLPEGERIFARDLETVQVESIMQYYAKAQSLAKIPLEVFIGGHAYASAIYVSEPERFGAKGHEGDYVRSTRQPVDDIENFVAEHVMEIEGLNFITADQKIKQEIRSWLETIPDIYLTSSAARYIEISHGSVSKWHAICAIADSQDINIEEIAAFGDGENDLEMITHAGFGVAMGNAVIQLKAAADYIAPDCEADGLAKTIDILIKNEINHG